MILTHALKECFTSPVRRRGEDYFESGAVHVVDHQAGWVEMEVEGSGNSYYAVTIQVEDASGSFELDCTCPHFNDGNNCKHLWAAARAVDELNLLGFCSTGAVNSTSANASSSSPDWQKRLSRHHECLTRSSRVRSTETAAAPRRVYYLLEVLDGSNTPVISLYQRQKKKNGEWGVAKPLRVDHETAMLINAPEDRTTLDLLLGSQVQKSPSDYYSYAASTTYNTPHATRVKLSPQLYATILPALCDTGRFVWLLTQEQGMDDARPIAWDCGKPWRFRIGIDSIDRKRKWRLCGELVRGKTVRPLRDAVHCFSSGLVLWEDRLARFEAPIDFRWVETLRENDELVIPTADREALLGELWRSGTRPRLVGDTSLQLPGETGSPTGRLVVHPPAPSKRYRQASPYLYASLGYLYEGHEASPDTQTDAWLSSEGDRIVQRDFDAEAKLIDRLHMLKLETKAISYYDETPPGHFQFSPRQLDHVVQTLVDEGWVVEAEGTRVRQSGRMSISVHSGIDWFDLEGHVDFDGLEASLSDLLAAVRQGKRYVQLGDGSRGLLPQQWLDQYMPLADLAPKQERGALRFQPSQALLLDSLLAARDADVELQVDRQFAALRKRLRSFQGVKPMDAPREFKGELRGYQKEGLGWLRFLEKFSFGGCLADDMGLGKTVQVLALLADRWRRQPKDAQRRPSLVVAPKSLIHNWQLEAERFAPRRVIADYTGIDRHERIEDFADYDLVLTTYGTLRQDIEWLSEQPWDYAVLDEAQAIKNAASQSAKASRLLRARHRLALSGTPVENHLGELWSIFEFLNPGLLGKSSSLGNLVRHSNIDDDKVELHVTALRQGLAPFLLRRTKQQVLPQLPKKTEQYLYCELSGSQRKQYNQLRNHYRASLTQKIAKTSLAKSKIHVLEALLRLRQAACHPGLIDERHHEKPSAKLDLLLDQLLEVIEEGHKALVFSQFTTMLAIVKNRLDKEGVVYEYLDGKTRRRQERIERFQSDDDCSVFLISLKAGGTGLNLTVADFVFLLDPWWNPAVEAQAIDRTHRLGQTKPVFAYRLIARDTVEEKILELQSKKRELASAIISCDSSLLKNLSADDLEALLS